jgi:hypothetical protein
MTSLATYRRPVKPTRLTKPAPVPFGHGILPVETPQERHYRESMEGGNAVFMGRAVGIPLDSPRYTSFVAAMNDPDPIMPRGFVAIGGVYVPSDAESVWATLDAERQEQERQEARWEALAEESHQIARLCGQLTDEDILIAMGCVG